MEDRVKGDNIFEVGGFGQPACRVDKQEQVLTSLASSKIIFPKPFLSYLLVTMKRGLEEMSAETPSLKKIKTTSDGEGSAELDNKGEQWTKVEKKKKKKKISKAEYKADVRISFLSW